ncbi:MAG TPA: class I SAM-dependent methyltransferase [Candidatus Nitrosopolaris sp.]|nr:class I SAM-dependent methyltransferase [Candidatus Nitrosopolaris sp.]
MLRAIITRGLAPFRWAVRFELERRKDIDLHDLKGELQRRARSETADYLSQYLTQVDSVDSHLTLLSRALKCVENKGGLYLEFGVFSGQTINYIARQVDQPVYGFDSFDGLPERWRDGLDTGHFQMQALPKVRKNVTLVKGWFDKTLPDFLEKHSGDVAFVHIDCDLYSSTNTVFTCLAPRIKPGTVMVFDEYFNYPGWKDGEFKAFQEFADREELRFEYLSYNCKGEQVGLKVTGKR